MVKLDGNQVLEYTDPRPLGRGHIGLQFNRGPIAFRNIKLRPLGLELLIKDCKLDGWKILNAGKFTFAPTGELNVRGGPGQLESERQFADFVLQTEIYAGSKDTNSGIFFRNIPGSFVLGYESQIYNAFKDGDRSKPLGCGTGGIEGLQDARRVESDDLQWFHETLVVSNNHIPGSTAVR